MLFSHIEGYTGGSLVHSPYYNDHKPGTGMIIIYLQTSSVSKQLKAIEELGSKMVGRCSKLNDFCHFRLDPILTYRITDRLFTLESHQTLECFFLLVTANHQQI